jgi:glycine oxidase
MVLGSLGLVDDVLILGGGVIGLSLAYELAGQGVKVRVLDRGTPGQEASWAGAGILPPANAATASNPYEQLVALSNELHAAWAERLREETGIDNGYRRTGGLHVARDSAGQEELRQELALCRAKQISAEEVPVDRLAEIEPAVAEGPQPAIRAALRLPGEYQLRNPRHLRALVTACTQRGVAIQPNMAAEDFAVEGGRIHGVRTAAGLLAAEKYCVCGGAWSGMLLTRLGIQIRVKPIRGQMVLLACPTPPLRHIIMEGIRYLVPRDDGRVLVGSTEDDAGFDKRPTSEGVDGLLRFALELAPCLKSAAFERSWAGLRPGTADRLPYLGTIPGMDNGFIAAGHFRSGLQLSPATAVVMAQLIRGRQPQIDLRPFAVDRG